MPTSRRRPATATTEEVSDTPDEQSLVVIPDKIDAPLKELNSALIGAAANFSSVVKDANNPFYKSKYATLGAVMDAILPALLLEGLFVQQEVRGYSLYTKIIHSSGEEQEYGPYPLPQIEDPQKFGSAITYARRYALMALFGIAPEDDDGNTATKAIEEEAKKRSLYSSKIKEIINQLDDTSSVPEQWERFSLENLVDLGKELKAKLESKK